MATLPMCYVPTRPYTETTLSNPADCNDAQHHINPGATERCSTADDDNCNGFINEENADNCTNFYKDADNDGYSIDETACYCVATGDYKLPSLSDPVDCCDTSAAANPNQEDWFASPMQAPCSGWDYNCDGQEERIIPHVGVCVLGVCSSIPGWSFTIPACGQEGGLINECSFLCGTIPYTQICR